MAQTWKYAIGLGLLGGALATGCVVKTGGDPDVGDAGEGGSGGSGGTTGGSGGKGGSTGGSSGKGGAGGTGGSTGGSAGKGGSAGTGGTTGGSAGTGGTTGGSAGTGGTGGDPTEQDKIPECDPATGNLDNTPYPSCEPADPEDPDPCEVCIQESCCEESIACYSFAPGNVCGWGGPLDGEYAGAGEIGCYVACLADYVDENGVCDEDGMGGCYATCQTEMCGDVLGNQTSELAACIHESCNDACLGISTCE